MKTAISIPDPVFRSAERLAQRLKLSRSELYVTALKTFLEKHRKGLVTGRLNTVYSHLPAQVDPMINDMQMHTQPNDEW